MIRKSVLLCCAPDQAFSLFTTRVSEWWPINHRPLKGSATKLFLEQSGRFWVRAEDGREAELGRVLAWERPHRLALDFYAGTGINQPTALEVIFTAEGEGTRVTVHHCAKPESEELWNQRAPVFEKSWEEVLGALATT